ncbi:peroxiredoxin Q [Irpex rosettiformis]|uniref:Peroxiredoxin Q n=1 Tax=Irpex rosettiformis TaxID=378272 RepID=A0ACB8TXM8_9APHY|nr:peroxiredoxin Q [Irpex rosettiformis]
MGRQHALIGKEAPEVSLPNYDGETYTLKPGSDGVPVALFFYPKSGTYGCTKEACEFRDALVGKETFKSTKVKVVGISSDPVEKQKEFVEKQKLTYPVLSDTKGEARKAYQTGKGLLGLTDARVTFIIDSKGVVRDALDATLNYGAHVKFVNKWLEKLEEEANKPAAETPAEDAPAADEAAAPPPAPKEEPATA